MSDEDHRVDIMSLIEDVSLAEAPGRRETDIERVQELTSFLQGEYRQNVLRKPALLQAHGAPKNDSDGRRFLADGDHTFSALAEMQLLQF